MITEEINSVDILPNLVPFNLPNLSQLVPKKAKAFS